MGGKAKAPPPPDYTPIANASKESAQYSFQLGKEQLQWAKDQYAQDKVTTDKVVNQALSDEATNAETAAKDRARYEQVYQPLEDDLVKDAASYATPQRKDLEMGRAQANVAQQFDGQRNAALQNLESFGVDPTSTRYAALDIGTRAAQAAATAAAGNQASEAVDATGRALRSEALNIGKGYPGQIAGQYGTALTAGQQAASSTLAQTASGANTMGTATQWQGMGNNALGVWGNTLHMGYQDQLAQFNANQNQSSGIGSALGLVGAGLVKAMPAGFLAEGGAVDDVAPDVQQALPVGPPGRTVPVAASPSGGRAVDDVQAIGPGGSALRVNAGEFIVPKDVVSWEGEKNLQKLIMKARQEKQGAPAKPQVRMAPAGPAQALPVG